MIILGLKKRIYTIADKLYQGENLHYWFILLLSAGILWLLHRWLQPKVEGFGDGAVLIGIVLIIIRMIEKLVKEGLVEKLRKVRLKYETSAKAYDLCMQARKPAGRKEKELCFHGGGKNCDAKREIEYFLEQEKNRSLHHMIHIGRI